jgi:uncharacterized membrane protein
MNFLRYTFRGAFGYYATLGLIVTALAMLVFYFNDNTQMCTIICATFIFLLSVGMVTSYIRWKHYQSIRTNRYASWRKRI